MHVHKPHRYDDWMRINEYKCQHVKSTHLDIRPINSKGSHCSPTLLPFDPDFHRTLLPLISLHFVPFHSSIFAFLHPLSPTYLSLVTLSSSECVALQFVVCTNNEVCLLVTSSAAVTARKLRGRPFRSSQFGMLNRLSHQPYACIQQV